VETRLRRSLRRASRAPARQTLVVRDGMAGQVRTEQLATEAQKAWFYRRVGDR
jgi:hypothetical protein